MFFGTTTVFLGQEVHYHMIYTAYYTELNCKICNYAQKRRIFRKQIRAWRFFFGIMCFIYCAKTLKSPTLDISNTNFKSFLPFALVKIRVQTSGSAAVAPEITWSASKPVSILHHKQAISNKLWCFVQFIAAWPILGRKTWKSSFFLQTCNIQSNSLNQIRFGGTLQYVFDCIMTFVTFVCMVQFWQLLIH